MIEGTVDDDGVPIILLEFGEQKLAAIVDTGFNGDLELPEILRGVLNPRFIGSVRSDLAGDVSIEEDVFEVTMDFDGRVVVAEASFSRASLGLVGTHFLRDYRLTIDFVARTLVLARIDEDAG